MANKIIFKIFSGILALLLVLIGVSAYLALFTAYPFRQAESLLTSYGIQSSPIQGSIRTGLTIDSLSYSGPKSSLTLKGAKFTYTGLVELLLKKELSISSVEIDDLKLVLNRTGEAQSASAPTPAGKISISDASIKKAEILIDGTPLPAMAFDMTIASGLKISPSEVLLDSATLKSKQLDLTLPKLAISDAEGGRKFEIEGEIKGQLKPALLTALKGNLPFRLKLNPGATGWEGTLSLQNEMIVISHSAAKFLSLALSDVTLGETFLTDFPAQAIKAQATATTLDLFREGKISWEGTFRLGEIEFTFIPSTPATPSTPTAAADAQTGGAAYEGSSEAAPTAAAQSAPESGSAPLAGETAGASVAAFSRDLEKFQIAVQLEKWNPQQLTAAAPTDATASAPAAPILVLSSNHGLPLDETLAQLHFRKKVAELTPEEKALVEKERPYFALGASLEPLLEKPKPIAPKGIKRPKAAAPRARGSKK